MTIQKQFPPLETIATLIDLYKISSNEVIEQILLETREYLAEQLGAQKKRKSSRKK